MTRRRLLLIAALGTGALVALANVEREAPPAPAPVPARPENPSGSPDRDPGLDLDLLEKKPPRRIGDAFARRSWAPPPAKPAAAPPPPRAVAPALPFDFLGRLEDQGRPTAVLRRGKEVVLARERENIDAAYRLESIGPGGLVITYLPLNQQQHLPYRK